MYFLTMNTLIIYRNQISAVAGPKEEEEERWGGGTQAPPWFKNFQASLHT